MILPYINILFFSHGLSYGLKDMQGVDTAKEVRLHVWKTQTLELREARVHWEVSLIEEKV